MAWQHLGWRGAVGMAMLAGVTSCVVPRQRVVQTIPPHERAVVEAAPLLRRLDLHVAPADLPSVLGPRTPTITPGPAILAEARSTDDAQRAIDCMTSAIYYEARSEPLDGQRAVAQVVLNRVRDRAFPNSVCGVVYQGSSRSTGCQFSFTCDGSLALPRDPASWERSHLVAMAALDGQVDADVGSATHYHTTAILPWWASSLVRLGAIGHHIFYRWPDALERALGYRQAYAGIEPGVSAAPAAPAAAPALTVAGVTVHRGLGDTVEFGVAVHRGLAAPVGFVSATAGSDVLPIPRRTVFSGVRVHRGVAPPLPAGDGIAQAIPVS